mmetsp:Transcript_3692/g.14513  ORF Transcript_3692/g.14513 Transcript_3692/m.14513 type:complete len:210 (-) Transcript_3692:987-1616(-)|eukprot:scaffold7363_cov263-Pinguiococcus_pyrenoidosus.AAC.14
MPGFTGEISRGRIRTAGRLSSPPNSNGSDCGALGVVTDFHSSAVGGSGSRIICSRDERPPLSTLSNACLISVTAADTAPSDEVEYTFSIFPRRSTKKGEYSLSEILKRGPQTSETKTSTSRCDTVGIPPLRIALMERSPTRDSGTQNGSSCSSVRLAMLAVRTAGSEVGSGGITGLGGAVSTTFSPPLEKSRVFLHHVSRAFSFCEATP